MPTEGELRSALQNPTDGVATLAGSIAARAQAKHVLVKLGEDGAVAFDATRKDSVSACSTTSSCSPPAVDPLGCGDAMLSVVGLTLAPAAGCSTRCCWAPSAPPSRPRPRQPLVLGLLLDRVEDEFEQRRPRDELPRTREDRGSHAVA